MKKIAVKTMSLLLAALIITGCTNDGKDGSSQTTTTKDASGETTDAGTDETPSVNRFGWEVPSETLSITFYDLSGNYSPTEEQKQGRSNLEGYFLEHFNVKLEMLTTDGDGTEALTLALTTGDYPEILTNITYATAVRLKNEGRLQDLTPYIDTVGTNIKRINEDIYPMLLDDDGKLFYIPKASGSIDTLPDYTAALRYDEMEQVGNPDIETPDDFYAAIQEILEENPTTPNGESRYALSFYNTMNYPVLLGGYWGLKSGWDIDEASNEMTYWAFSEKGKKMTAYFNQIYQDGLLDPDSFANKFDDWKVKFSGERVVGNVGAWWTPYNAGHEVWQALDPETPEEKRYVHLGFKDPDIEQATITGKNKFGTNVTVITDKADNTEDLMKFLNFQATERGLALMNWGIPNGVPSFKSSGDEVILWSIDENGEWAFDQKAKQQLINETWDYAEESLTGAGLYTLVSTVNYWDDGIHCIWANQMWHDENRWKKLMIDNLEGTIFDATAMTMLVKSDEYVLIEQAVTDTWKQYWPITVQSNSDAEFEANWETMQNAFTAANIERYVEIFTENYQNNMNKLSN